MGLIGDWLNDDDIAAMIGTNDDDEINDQYQAGCKLFGETQYRESIQRFTANIHRQCQAGLVEALCFSNDPNLSFEITWLIDQPTLIEHRHLRWDIEGLRNRKHDLIELIRIDPQRFHALLGSLPIICDEIVIDDPLKYRCFTWDRSCLSLIPGLTSDDRRRIDLAYQAIDRLTTEFGAKYRDLSIHCG